MKLEPRPAPPPIRGFRFAGIHGGIKSRGRRDFALIVADKPAVCAGVFTTNKAAAAPVEIARRHVAAGHAQAIMINSGNANAATGDKGRKLAQWSCEELAARLSIPPEAVVPCSTGVIGVQLERTTVARAISLAVDALSPRGFVAAARAIMTSDAFPKWTHRTIALEGRDVLVAGMAKGAGMIAPNMATMLAFVLTDAALSPEAARAMVEEGVRATFNRINVDGDTSTNDSVVLLASAQSAAPAIDDTDAPGYAELATAVREVMDDLARQIVADGEGAEHVVDIVVEGAGDDAAADLLARAIARSVLVRCALAGADPNWGRLVCAIGNSGVECDIDRIAVDVAGVTLVRDGALVSEEARRAARKEMRKPAYTLRVSVGDGPGCGLVVTSDLTEAYVRYNAAYTS